MATTIQRFLLSFVKRAENCLLSGEMVASADLHDRRWGNRRLPALHKQLPSMSCICKLSYFQVGNVNQHPFPHARSTARNSVYYSDEERCLMFEVTAKVLCRARSK